MSTAPAAPAFDPAALHRDSVVFNALDCTPLNWADEIYLGKLAASGWVPPEVDPGVWPVSIAALLVGLVLGDVLGTRISHSAARTAVIVIAYLGGIAALVDGAINLAG